MTTGEYRMTWPILDPRITLDALIGQAQHDLAQALASEGLRRDGAPDWRISNQRGPRLTVHLPVSGATEVGDFLPPRELQPHGTHAAFVRHRAQGHEPCTECVEGERAYQRSRHARRRIQRLQAS